MQYSEVPWKDILVDTKQFTVFKDKYPVTEGHVLFVPKVEDWEHLTECFNGDMIGLNVATVMLLT